ncbi:hypothetical protein, variant [Aphanomyces invadans]|uniref:Methyltransferase domain-containing protein n=1 Tax=Aphanomyces invadans TaxID=157072 RepID=A0A024UNM1_9STRA|nr:hypothetical protein, variant [Aphanomyces invadans]ETW07238.1 hypothetical protein, variant [Aphanomyces invadans]|eukprot:XP_008863331.1 hypothetical protein, variant [Aphanomyces invadans]
MMAASTPTPEKTYSYDDLYSCEAVFSGALQYVNMGLHPVDTESMGIPKMHALVQPHQQQLYLALLTQPRVLHLLERAASETRPVHVLDVGCGIGASLVLIARVLSARAPSVPIVVCGIDKSRVAVKQHKRLFHVDKTHRGVLHYDLELQRMSAFARHRFDIVMGVQSFQEMNDNPDAAIAEVARVLKPQGVLLVADFYTTFDAHQPFDASFLGHIRSHPSFDLHFEQDISHAATIAAKLTSAKTVDVVGSADVAKYGALLTLKKSRRYEAVRLGRLHFGLFGWHSVVDPELEDDVINSPRDSCDNVIDGGETHHEEDEDDIDDAMNESYFDYKKVFPDLELLKRHVSAIQAEAAAAQLVASWPNWPEDHYIGNDGEWRVFPLCYTFPAWDATKTVWVEPTCAQCPKTVALLRQLPNLRTALFSNLGPNTHLGAHRVRCLVPRASDSKRVDGCCLDRVCERMAVALSIVQTIRPLWHVLSFWVANGRYRVQSLNDWWCEGIFSALDGHGMCSLLSK